VDDDLVADARRVCGASATAAAPSSGFESSDSSPPCHCTQARRTRLLLGPICALAGPPGAVPLWAHRDGVPPLDVRAHVWPSPCYRQSSPLATCPHTRRTLWPRSGGASHDGMNGLLTPEILPSLTSTLSLMAAEQTGGSHAPAA
jgi:hypothetical protein